MDKSTVSPFFWLTVYILLKASLKVDGLPTNSYHHKKAMQISIRIEFHNKSIVERLCMLNSKHGNLVHADASSGAKASPKHLESCLEVIQGHAFWDHWNADEGLRNAYCCIIMWTLESEISKERYEHLRFREPHSVIRCLCLQTPCEYSHNCIGLLLETRSLTYILPLIVWIYLHSNFSGGLSRPNKIFFCKSAFRRFKVTNFGTNRKRVCDFY